MWKREILLRTADFLETRVASVSYREISRKLKITWAKYVWTESNALIPSSVPEACHSIESWGCLSQKLVTLMKIEGIESQELVTLLKVQSVASQKLVILLQVEWVSSHKLVTPLKVKGVSHSANHCPTVDRRSRAPIREATEAVQQRYSRPD